ncbi:MAG: signal peptidase I [Tepidiformaceae bacterium]
MSQKENDSAVWGAPTARSAEDYSWEPAPNLPVAPGPESPAATIAESWPAEEAIPAAAEEAAPVDDFEQQPLHPRPDLARELPAAPEPAGWEDTFENPGDGELIAGMRQWASGHQPRGEHGSGHEAPENSAPGETTHATSRWDEMVRTPSAEPSLLDGLRQWATTSEPPVVGSRHVGLDPSLPPTGDSGWEAAGEPPAQPGAGEATAPWTLTPWDEADPLGVKGAISRETVGPRPGLLARLFGRGRNRSDAPLADEKESPWPVPDGDGDGWAPDSMPWPAQAGGEPAAAPIEMTTEDEGEQPWPESIATVAAIAPEDHRSERWEPEPVSAWPGAAAASALLEDYPAVDPPAEDQHPLALAVTISPEAVSLRQGLLARLFRREGYRDDAPAPDEQESSEFSPHGPPPLPVEVIGEGESEADQPWTGSIAAVPDPAPGDESARAQPELAAASALRDDPRVAGAPVAEATWDWESGFSHDEAAHVSVIDAPADIPAGDYAADRELAPTEGVAGTADASVSASAATLGTDDAEPMPVPPEATDSEAEDDDHWASFMADRGANQHAPALAPLPPSATRPLPMTSDADDEMADDADDPWAAIAVASGYGTAGQGSSEPEYDFSAAQALAEAGPEVESAREHRGLQPGPTAPPPAEDRDWGPSPNEDPRGFWSSSQGGDDVVLRAFEAHASTETQDGGDPGEAAHASGVAFRSLLGDDAEDFFGDGAIPEEDQPSPSRLRGSSPQRRVGSTERALPSWTVGGAGEERDNAGESRPDGEGGADGEGPAPAGLDSPFDDTALPAAARSSRGRTLVRELVETGLLALLVFLSVRASFQNFKVDGLSMMPALEDGEFLIVNKLVYSEVDLEKLNDFLPFVDAGEDPKRNVFHGPQRGDIIVLKDPRNQDVDLIKRVIGLPGETVEIRNGTVYVNDRKLIEPYIASHWQDNKAKVTVPPDEYYVLGDNRENSLDSRNQGVGFVHKDLIIGKALVTYWPRSKFGLAPNGSPTLEEAPALSSQHVDD